MKYIVLLTDAQKKAGYFVTQDEDFIWLWRGDKKTGEEPHHPMIIAVFLYQDAKVKQIRDTAENNLREENDGTGNSSKHSR